MSTTPVLTPERSVELAVPSGKRSRSLPILALIAVVVIVGVGLWLVLAADNTPTATFDGETATYSGPTMFQAGTITFTFDATEYDTTVAFVVTEVTDDAIMMADIEAYAAENPAAQVPSWSGAFRITFVTPDEVVEKELTLTEGTWLVSANTSPTETDRVYPAALIEVIG